MEQLLHYVWKHKLFPLAPLVTTDGREVEVVHPGLHNHDAGPDFFNAKVKIGGELWVGNVEIHERSSDWFRHRHDHDPAYANVVLHVVGEADAEVPCPSVEPVADIPQLVLPVPDDVQRNYEQLAHADRLPRCGRVVGTLPRLTVSSWLSALQVERLEEKTRQVMERRRRCTQDWEAAFFVTLARSFGFGINGDAMEQWALQLPLSAVAKHRDDLFQVEALFFGQAGLLEVENDVPYCQRLSCEYAYLRHKFSLTPMDARRWRFARLRPQNTPYIRLAQLAMLYYEGRLNLSAVVEAQTLDQLYALFDAHVSDFWQTHYSFSSEPSAQAERRLSTASLDSVVINAVVPVLFAYGRYKSEESLCERALQMLEQLPAEQNSVVRAWAQAGVNAETAGDTQALVQLTRRYCEPRDCLRCRFGYEYLRCTPDFLREIQS